VTQPGAGYSGDNWASHLGITHRPGTTISINGTLQVCTSHPGILLTFARIIRLGAAMDDEIKATV
jgi:hypothetical protein